MNSIVRQESMELLKNEGFKLDTISRIKIDQLIRINNELLVLSQNADCDWLIEQYEQNLALLNQVIGVFAKVESGIPVNMDTVRILTGLISSKYDEIMVAYPVTAENLKARISAKRNVPRGFYARD